jgi:hypothetical protein
MGPTSSGCKRRRRRGLRRAAGGLPKAGLRASENELGHGADLGRSKRLGGLKQKKRKKEGEIDLKF